MRMKRLLTFLTLLTVFIGVGWATDVTYTFNSKSWGATPANWSGTADGNSFNTSQTPPGVQVTTGKGSGATVTCPSSYSNISKVTVTYSSSSKAVGNIEVKVGTTSLGSKSVSKSQTRVDLEYTANNLTGVVSFIPTVTTNSIGINSVTITYSEGGTQTVATPTFSPAAGTYSEAQNVTISCATSGATIHYTTDGSTPTTNSPTYSSAIPVSSTTTIKAIAVKSGMNNSSVATATYTITAPLTSLAVVNELPRYTEFTYGAETVVMGVYGNTKRSMYIVMPDNTAGTLIYDAENAWADGYTFGQVIKSGWSGKKDVYNTKPEIVNPVGFELKGETTTVTPFEISSNDDLTEANFGRYAVIKNVQVAADGSVTGLTTYNQFGISFTDIVTSKKYNVYGVIGLHNSTGQFMPLSFEEVVEDPGDGYYLVGTFNMDGDNWVAKDARYKFSGEGTTLTLNDITLPDNVQFKIVKWEGTTQTWYGGLTQDDNQQNPYGLHRDWHTNIPLTNSYNNNYVKNFSIAAGAVTNFTLNTSTLKFDVQRDEQLYVKGDFNEWGKTPMNSTSTGWTINQAISAEDEFGFVDEWGDWHGGDGYWIYQEEHEAFGETKPSDIGQELDITSSDNFYMVTAGTYTLNVNSNLTKLVVYVPLAINCTATSDVEGKAGGTVVAKVEGNTVTAAQTGETVVLEVTPWNGYTLSSVTLNGSALTANEGVYSFEMPNVAANVVANFTVNYYDLVLQNDETLGEVSGLPQNMKAYTGQEVSFSVTALGENEIDKVTYEYNGGNPQTLTATEGTYKFNMPPFEVTIKVTYIEPLQPCTIRFEESWPETAGLGGNDDVWSTSGNSPAAVSQNLGWIYKDGDTEFQGYGADNCIRIGKRNGAGSATTPEIIVTNGTIYKMTFRAGGWTSDNTTINLSAEGAELFSDANCTTSIETETITSESWTEFEVYVKATSSLMRITWAAPPTRSRFFLDDVVIDFFETPLPTEATLAQIITLGENADGKLYKISNEDGLLGVYSQGQSVWFKDEYPEQAVDYQDPLENTNYKYYTVVEDALEINKSEKDFDQSNWIEVVFQDNASYNNKHVKNLTGTYSWQNGNPKLTLTVDVDETNDVTDVPVGALAYDLNPYMAANFAGTQDGTIQGDTHTYFFSQPKAQEYAQILWAVWDGSKFNMPTTNNAYGFTGSFTVSDELNGGVSLDGLQQGETYNFKAVIRKTASKAGSYEVYPTDLNPGVVTGVGMINVNGNVKSVKYVNVAGIVSDVPFQGVNIVVTEYTDGSRTTTKMLKK